jgi:transposase
MPPTPRPSLLDLHPDVFDVLVDAARKGHFLEHAADLAEISRRTVYRWLERGDADDAPAEDARLVEFARAWRRARAEFIAESLKTIAERKNGWKALAWRLERLEPAKFGRRLTTELVGPEGGPLQHQVTGAVMFLPPRAPDPTKPPDDGSST